MEKLVKFGFGRVFTAYSFGVLKYITYTKGGTEFMTSSDKWEEYVRNTNPDIESEYCVDVDIDDVSKLIRWLMDINQVPVSDRTYTLSDVKLDFTKANEVSINNSIRNLNFVWRQIVKYCAV